MPIAAALPFISAAFSIYGALSQGGGNDQPAVVPPKPVKPPQAAKVPEQAVYKKGMAGAGAGDPTALTGPGGIPSDKLYLGKSTVLGG